MVGRFFLFTFALFICFIQPCSTYAEDSLEILVTETVETTEPIKTFIYSEHDAVFPGKPIWIAVRFVPEPGWHLYWKKAGDAGFPPSITWHLPEGFLAGEIMWPYPERFEDEGLVSFGYSHEVTLLVPISPTEKLVKDGYYELSADIDWLSCSSSTCQPSKSSLTLKLPIAAGQDEGQVNPGTAQIFAAARAHIASKPPAGQVITSKSSDGLLSLFIGKKENDPCPVKAQFFPYEDAAIDYHFSPIINEQKDGWDVVLKLPEDAESDLTRLEGELVFESDNGIVAAWAVDLPVGRESFRAVSTGEVIGLVEERSVPGISLSTTMSSVHAEDDDMTFFTALLMAFAGGILLNFMPCVLPVVSLKILSFVKMAGQKRNLVIYHSLAFTAGVLLSFLALAAFLLVLRSWGQMLGWGFQLQDPFFVAGLMVILFVLSLNMLGVMELGTGIASWAGSQGAAARSNKGELFSSFFSGVLATVVATPCTGPFLGVAIGFTMTLPVVQSLTIFASVALGMSLPYIMLACSPSLLRFVPKPGPWMVYLKQCMGFLLLGSVLYLLWVLQAHLNADGFFSALIWLLIISVVCWIVGTWDTPVTKKKIRWIARCAALVLIVSSFYWLKDVNYFSEDLSASDIDSEIAIVQEPQKGSAPGKWHTFSPQKVAELRQRGVPVFIDFTARWCTVCLANHKILTSSEVEELFNERGVVRLKADWTRYDPVITEALAEFGRNTLPLYVYYSGKEGEPAKILPQLLTPSIVRSYLEE
jgi:thiol:disulfide interchange protein/DsbC/DsbD-like thiol-disulfide interchange protein